MIHHHFPLANYMIFRLSLLVLASVAALFLSQINNFPSNNNHSGRYGSSFQQIEGKEEEDKFTDDKVQQEETRKMIQDLKPEIHRKHKELSTVSEMELLHNLIKELEKRRLAVEGKLLQLYGLKQQQSHFAQWGRRLEEKMADIDMLNDIANSLQDEIKKLQEEMRQAKSTQRQMGMAKSMMEELQMKINVNTRHMRKQLLMLEEQVSGFRGNEISISDAMIENKLNDTRQVELESVKMQRRNKELELEKRELAVKLLGAQAIITAFSTITDGKIIANISQDMSILRHTNEDLSKEVERLQKNRYDIVEELVYQRWLNACLRFEIQGYRTPSISRIDSSSTESNGIDSSSTTGSSLNSQRSIGKKYGFMQRIKRWGSRNKDDLSSASSTNNSRRGIGPIRRFSASVVPSRPSVLSTEADSVAVLSPYPGKKMGHELTESPCTPNFPRARRVSFCDSEVKDDKEMCSEKSDQNSTISIDVSPKSKCVAKLPEVKNEVITLPKHDYPSDSISSNDRVDTQVDTRIQSTHTDIVVAHFSFTAALFFFMVFMLLVYFLFNLTAGIY
ncbi:hypothetical protein Ddye_002146 [Dipteronia dyeriana]|uniref:Uncharacterized protein n=1 Tax=Dipteronia dyeriana TaxID=168575 RepID=A0AAD9XQX9_9ROSI|nr:hypothetical protein Ddye_002146 [Dipteronia dyeriana]